jgi:hypothetical protein
MRTPIAHHPWIGPLWQHGDRGLVGSISIDPAIRPARDNGSTDAEVLINIVDIEPGPALDTRLATAAGHIRDALANLHLLKQYGVEHAPAGWREHYESLASTPLTQRLFVDGFEVTETLAVMVYFDFGDLDLLVVELDSSGQPTSVKLRP